MASIVLHSQYPCTDFTTLASFQSMLWWLFAMWTAMPMLGSLFCGSHIQNYKDERMKRCITIAWYWWCRKKGELYITYNYHIGKWWVHSNYFIILFIIKEYKNNENAMMLTCYVYIRTCAWKSTHPKTTRTKYRCMLESHRNTGLFHNIYT